MHAGQLQRSKSHTSFLFSSFPVAHLYSLFAFRQYRYVYCSHINVSLNHVSKVVRKYWAECACDLGGGGGGVVVSGWCLIFTLLI